MNYLLTNQESQRLSFRKLERSDFNACLEFFQNPLSNRYWKSDVTDPVVLCKDWSDKQFSRYKDNKGGMNVLIHKKSQELIGWCGLLIQIVDNVEELEVGYSIIPKYWGNGYATEAVKKCVDYAFENNLRDSIISIIQVNNVESERVAIKNGLIPKKQAIYHNNVVNIFRINNKCERSD